MTTHGSQARPRPSGRPRRPPERPGLRYSTDARPGITRRRAGRGFSYRTADGATIRDRAVLRRIRALAIPPAWTDVWICPDPAGHLQATGRDARGRKQYRYHARWRARRDDAKFERLIDVRRGPAADPRRAATRTWRRPGWPREKVLAAVVRLLELTLIRVGNDEYARLNRSFGLTTLENRHATVDGTAIRFRFRGKSGQRHEVGLRDRRLAAVVRRCQDLPGQELFQYVDDDGVAARRRVGRRQRLPARDLRRGRHGQGLPDVGRHGAGLSRAARARAGRRRARRAAQRRRGGPADGRTGSATPRPWRARSYVHPAILEAYLDGTIGGALLEAAEEQRDPPSAADPGRGSARSWRCSGPGCERRASQGAR